MPDQFGQAHEGGAVMRYMWVPLLASLVLLGGCRPHPATPGIGIAFGSFDSPEIRKIRFAIGSLSRAGTEFAICDAGNQQNIQSSQIDKLLSLHVKALAVNLVLPEAADLVIDKAKAGIVPLVLFGREASPEDMKKWDRVYYVGARWEQACSVQGQILADWWKANPAAHRNHDDVIEYVLLGGEAQENADAAQNFESSLGAAGLAFRRLASVTATGTAGGAAAMRSLLAAYGTHIKAVVCRGDAEALGAVECLRANGWFSGKKYMPVLGVGATPAALDAIAAGTLLGSAGSDADGEARAVCDLSRALAGGGAPSRAGWQLTDGKYIWIPYRMVTARNYAIFGN
ncbi:MAG TPA: substrate-binding domain-containing protein [Rectinemataceae bacterium]|nr:substrate-binding domain-containing protein [Rectinemataceae bacterium]